MSDLDARLRWMGAREVPELVDLLCRSVPVDVLVQALAAKYGIDVPRRAETSAVNARQVR